MNDKLAKFEKLLKGVSDSYDFFVSGSLMEAEDSEEYIDKVTQYIENHPDATTSEIIQFETEEIFGIKPIIQ